MVSLLIILGIIVGITQALYTRLSMGPANTVDPSPVEASFSGDLAKSFDLQMRYFLPVVIGGISAFTLVAAAPLFWGVGNIFMIGQELVMGRRFSSPKAAVSKTASL